MAAAAHAGTIIRHIRDLIEAETTRRLTDAQVLERFARYREEAAFAALMKRHGRLVWGVCRHILNSEQDAEDAFQATFLVLARRPEAVRKPAAVGSWLYGVAYRVAMKAKKNACRRHAYERRATERPSEQPATDQSWRDLQAVLDEEVQRLPEKYRVPFVLCCLEGKTREEVGREFDLRDGTVSSRIARARRLLQSRLTRRGVMLSAALCAHVLWSRTATAGVPKLLAGNTIQAACTATSAAAARVSGGALALADGAVRAMALAKWQVGAILLLACSLLVTGAGVGIPQTPSEPVPVTKPAADPLLGATVKKDLHGDDLPPGALARLGTIKQRAGDSQLAVSADGKELVTVDSQFNIRRFDAMTGALRLTSRLPKAPGDLAYHPRLSPRGTLFTTTAYSPTGVQIELWDVARGKLVKTLPLDKNFSPWNMTFSANEGYLAIADSIKSFPSGTHRVLVWDLKTFDSKVLWNAKKDTKGVPFEPVVALSSDGKRLAACHLDQILRCWEVGSGNLLWELKERTWTGLMFFSPDGRMVVTASGMGIAGINRWDSATGKLIEPKIQPPEEARYPIGFAPDGRFMAFETGFDELVLWEPGASKTALRLPAPPPRRHDFHYTINRLPSTFVFTPDGKGLIRRAGALQRWDLRSGKPVYAKTDDWGHTEAVTRLLFSPDGRLLASLANDGRVRLWNVATGRPSQVFLKSSEHLAFTSDSRSLFISPIGVKEKLRQCAVASGAVERVLKVSDKDKEFGATSDKEIRISPDGRKVFMLSWKNGQRDDESVFTSWDLVTGVLLDRKVVPWAQDSVLMPDGASVLAFDSRAAVVKLLDVASGQTRLQFQTDRTDDSQLRVFGCDLGLSPSGRLMAAHAFYRRGNQGTTLHDDIRVGDMVTGRQLLKVPDPGLDALTFAFSPDDRLFAVATAVKVRLWETASWREVGSISVSGSPITCRQGTGCVALSPDGRTLATGHSDGTILLWDATLRGGRCGGALSSSEAHALWKDLGRLDASRGNGAIWRLVDDQQGAISLLKARLQPVAAPPASVIRPLLNDLDSGEFKVRRIAEQKLRAFGDVAEPAIRQALKANPSLEKRRRHEALLGFLNSPGPLTGEALQAVRAVHVLERIGTWEARRILERLAKGIESARLTRAAREALARK